MWMAISLKSMMVKRINDDDDDDNASASLQDFCDEEGDKD